MASVSARRSCAVLGQSLWRGLQRVQGSPPLVPATHRPLQTSCDDRDIGSNTFPRKVRVYDPNGKLSRHMNPDIDELVHKFESSLGLPPLMTKEWEKYEPAAAKLVSIKTQRFANYVGLEKSERLLGRKVEAEFSPWELGLSEEAVHKLIQIVGPRYKPASKSVKIVAREASSSEHNRVRVLQQVAQLLYHSKRLASK